MDLFTISYRSRAMRKITPEYWQQLEQTSRERNASMSITGVLVFDGTHFIQTIEGPRIAVSSLMQKIQSDPAHGELMPFGVRPITKRFFAGWTMKAISANSLPGHPLSKLGLLNLRDLEVLKELNANLLAA